MVRHLSRSLIKTAAGSAAARKQTKARESLVDEQKETLRQMPNQFLKGESDDLC